MTLLCETRNLAIDDLQEPTGVSISPQKDDKRTPDSCNFQSSLPEGVTLPLTEDGCRMAPILALGSRGGFGGGTRPVPRRTWSEAAVAPLLARCADGTRRPSAVGTQRQFDKSGERLGDRAAVWRARWRFSRAWRAQYLGHLNQGNLQAELGAVQPAKSMG
jgi:hypothetical protein